MYRELEKKTKLKGRVKEDEIYVEKKLIGKRDKNKQTITIMYK